MIIAAWAVCALLSFVIAAVAVGSVVGEQSVRPDRAVYVVDDAVEFIADRLPDEVSAVASYDDVRAVVDARLDYLRTRGVASERTFDTVGDDLVLVDEDEPLAWVLGAVAERDLDDAHVLAILDAESEYARSVGVVGPALP